MYLRSDKVFLCVLFSLCILVCGVSVVYAEEQVSEPESVIQDVPPTAQTPPSTDEAVDSLPPPEPIPQETLPVETPEAKTEEPAITPEIPALEVQPVEIVPVPDSMEAPLQVSDTSTTADVSEVAPDVSADTASTTDPVLEEIVSIGMEDDVSLMTRAEGESALFAIGGPLVFTLIAETPLQKNEEKNTSEQESIVAEVVRVAEQVMESVVDTAVFVVDTVVEIVTEVIEEASELMIDEEDIMVSDSVEPVLEKVIEDAQVLKSDEEVTPVSENVEEVIIPSEPETAIPAESEGLQVNTFIDGVLVTSSYVLRDEYSIVVEIHPDTIEPGVHTVRIEALFDGKKSIWEGECTWGGIVMYSREVGSGVWAIVLEDVTGGMTLFLQEYNGVTFTYTMLDDTFTLAQAPSITSFESTLFWLSSQKDMTYGYDILSRTQFSQSLEALHESEIVIHESEYKMSTRVAEPQFTPTVTTSE